MRILKVGASLLAALLIGTLLAACGGSSDSPSDGDGEAMPKVRLATGVDASYAPVYVAGEKDLFRKHGVDVEYITTEGGPATGQAVIAGSAEMGTLSDGTTTTLMGQDPELVAISVIEESSEYIKVILRNEISDSSEIKVVSAVPGIIEMATTRYLENEGLDPAKIEFVPATPPDVPSLMQRNDIDAAVMYEPWATRIAEAGGRIVGDIGDFGMKYEQWVVTNETWVKANAETAAKVISALEEASDFVNENPEEAAKITMDAVQVPEEQTLSLLPLITFKQRDIEESDKQLAFDSASYFVEVGGMKEVPDLDRQVILGWKASVK